jgi:D-alanyl-D-alanine dipeptidase
MYIAFKSLFLTRVMFVIAGLLLAFSQSAHATTQTTKQVASQDVPPAGTGNYRASDLVELIKLDPSIKLDIRYATSNNFVGKPVYSEAHAFLQRPAALALVAAHKWLQTQGYGIVVYDAYRPWAVTKLFWDITPVEKRIFVADPAVGSKHNRGCAVDIGLVDLKTGKIVEMPGDYDEMSERSFVTYTGGTEAQRAHRDLLRKALEREGNFFVYPEEWWHYDFKDSKDYAVQNMAFSEIKFEATASQSK